MSVIINQIFETCFDEQIIFMSANTDASFQCRNVGISFIIMN